MKKIFILLLTVTIPRLFYGQEVKDTIGFQIKDLIVPSSPAFSILDFSPKLIERPGTIKALALNILNETGEAGGIPKNFALEFSPYWFFRHPTLDIYEFNGIELKNDSLLGKQKIFSGIKMTSISAGSVFKDSSKAMPIDVNYLSFGVRTNIITIRNRKVLELLIKKIQTTNENLGILLASVTCEDQIEDPQARAACIAEGIGKKLDAQRKEYVKISQIRPVLAVDLALSSSIAFGDNSFDKNKRYRSGGWFSFAWSNPLLPKKDKANIDKILDVKNYINVYGMFRLLDANETKDFITFTNESYLDIGGRLEFEFDKIALSFETLHRTNRNDKDRNANRTVGIIQYKINDNLYLLGTFGKNFETVKNIVAFFGLNWGFGSNPLYQKYK